MRLRKAVVTEQRQVDVPVTREEVVLERHPVPIMEEEVRVEKRPVVKEEVTLGKRKVTETNGAAGWPRADGSTLQVVGVGRV